MKINYADLGEIELPKKTASYCPVPHSDFYHVIKDSLQRKSMEINSESLTIAKNGMQLFGVFNLETGNPHSRMSIGFRNSYDKSLAAGMVAGANVIVCSNLMFKGDIMNLRKHTSNVWRDLDDLVNNTIDLAEHEYEVITKDTETMKAKAMTPRQMAEHAGILFVENGLLNTTQMTTVKHEIKNSAAFLEPTSWDFYNHCTEALKSAHVAHAVRQHTGIHNYVLNNV
jgi:hypothetical protein